MSSRTSSGSKQFTTILDSYDKPVPSGKNLTLLSGGVHSFMYGVGVTKAVTVEVSPKQIGFTVSSVVPKLGLVLTLIY